MRDDYFTHHNEMLLFNPDWVIAPSISFINGKGPRVLTCMDHDGGTNKMYIHPCRWKHNLSSNVPDQLCQTVVQPRILKPMKASSYSTSYQLFKQSGSFNGIDTCSATMFGRFDLPVSLLLNESEGRSLQNRPDLVCHVSKLQEEVCSIYDYC